MHVLIATPTAGNLVTTAYSTSLINATLAMTEIGLTYGHKNFDGSDISMARNFLANYVLQRPALSHILFIDSDMNVPMGVFQRMLAADHPICGSVYTERNMDLEAWRKARNDGFSDAQARGLASQFNVRLNAKTLRISGGFCPVDGFGFGCVLIKRELLERMAAEGAAEQVPTVKLAPLLDSPTMVDFFGELPTPEGTYLSEDYSFCERVRRLGDVPLMALVDIPVGHVGQMEYKAALLDWLIAQDTPAHKG